MELEQLQILLRKHKEWSVIETHQFEQIDQIIIDSFSRNIICCIKLRCVKCGIELDSFPSPDGRRLRWMCWRSSVTPVSCHQMMLEKALE